jgi:hypothetical protein
VDRRFDVGCAIGRAVLHRDHVPALRVDAFAPHEPAAVGAEAAVECRGRGNEARRAAQPAKALARKTLAQAITGAPVVRRQIGQWQQPASKTPTNGWRTAPQKQLPSSLPR